MGEPKRKPEAAADPFAGLDAVDPVVAPAGDAFAGLEAVPPPPPPASPRAQRIKDLEAFNRGARQGVLFGLGDEVAGLTSKAAGFFDGGDIPRAAHRGTLATRAAEEAAPLSERTDYDVSRDEERRLDRQAAADTAFDKSKMSATAKFLTPDSMFGVGEGAGTLATGALPIGGTAARAATLGARLKAGAKVGAALGGAAGFGNAEGTAGEQALQTAVGAGGGAVLGGAGGELARLAGRAAGGARRLAGNALDRYSNGAAAREVQFGSPELARTAERFVDPTNAELRAAATRGGDAQHIEKGSRELAGNIDELLKHGDVVRWDEDVAAKGDHIRHMMNREQPPPDALPQADAVYDAVKGEWDLLARDVDKGEGAGTIRQLQREAFDAYENRLKKAADTFDPKDPTAYTAERFMALDDLKRHLQKGIAVGRVPFADRMRERMEVPLRTALEDPAIWGEGPAALQKLRNAGWTRRLSATGRPENAFLASGAFGERSSDPYRVLDRSDVAKVHGINKSAGTIEGEPSTQALTEWANREAGLLEALTGHEGADPALVERATRARELATSIQGAMKARTADARAAAELQRVNDRPEAPASFARQALEAFPTPIGPMAQRTRAMPTGKRAARMAELEDLLRVSPGNEQGARDLSALTPGGGLQELGVSGGRGTERAGSNAAGAAARTTGLGASYARKDDRATDDPEWGGLISSKQPGEARDATYSMLIQTDSAFRARERERAHKRNDDEGD